MPILKVYSWSRLVSYKTNRFLCLGLSILEFQTCIEFKVRSELGFGILRNIVYLIKYDSDLQLSLYD